MVRAAPGPRILWADLVRVTAIFGVVLIHAAAAPVLLFGRSPIGQWWAANGYRSLGAFAMPCLVMLSGALLLTRDRWDARDFVQRRLWKVAVPLMAWSLIYTVWEIWVLGEPKTAAIVLRELAGDRLGNPVSNHLWFLYLILSLYLLAPILRVYVCGASLGNQLYFAGLWVIASWLLPLVRGWTGIQIGLYLDSMAGMVGYFILGATIERFAPPEMKPRWLGVSLVALVMGWVVTAAGTYFHTLHSGTTLSESYYAHLSLNVMAMGVSAFVLLRHYGTRLSVRSGAGGRFARTILHLGGLSYGIYLVHMVVVSACEWGVIGVEIRRDMLDPLWWVPAFASGVFVLSGVVVDMLRRLPYLRWLVP